MNLVAGIKNGLRIALYHSGALGLLHRWRNRHALTVLMFHRVLPSHDPAMQLAEREFTLTLDAFQRILDFVVRHYHVVSLADLDAAHRGDAPMPATPLLITFDDGWRDTLTWALPELTKRHLPAVMFVPSEVPTLAAARWWQDALAAGLRQAPVAARLCADAGAAVTASDNVGQSVAAYVAAMPPDERCRWMERHAPGMCSQVQTRQMVTCDELDAVCRTRMAVGGHGHTHGPLTLMADPAAELLASRRMLERLGQRICSMSFPHGAWSAGLVAAARAVGLTWLFTSDPELTDVRHWPPLPTPIGRIHVSENPWTCTGGRVAPARLATYLFLRPIRGRRSVQP